MGTTVKEDKFIKIFKNSLKIDARTISIKTLLSERNLRRINYTPYYQRNYVWDNIKQTFFIESVILGTEIPPLIFFKSGMRMEVIDGRQRFETLKRFKENDLMLSGKGLMTLPALARTSFNKMAPEIQDIFWNSNIRIFEFEVINEPNLDPEIEDKIKKEIFRRYNTGITPLTSTEVDNAKYNDDELSILFTKYLKKNNAFLCKMEECFFGSISNSAELVVNIVNYIRRCYTLSFFPISKYAAGSDRTETLDLLYDFATQNIEDYDREFKLYKSQIDKVIYIYDKLSQKDERLKNKYIYECLLWGVRILDNESIELDLDDLTAKASNYYSKNIDIYSNSNPHYYKSIIDRFSDTAIFLKNITSFDFDIYLKNNGFKDTVKDIKQTEQAAVSTIEQLSNLRTNKPAPISTPIDEIKNDIKTSNYLVRPTYQRQEKINQLKASSIIESILLGINLPPIFVFKRTNGIKEVIDGQQRLLSIIGFLGEQYKNEEGKLVISRNNNFKLKSLKILSELNGCNYSDLNIDLQDKILDFTIDVIIIEENINPTFDPTDLFIRLNNKPYPIEQNSFEMWNSTIDKDIVQKAKDVTKKYSSWFFSKESNLNEENRTDRMENEELITILSYISYHGRLNSYEKILGFFNRQDRITCRLKNKTGMTDFLSKLEKEANEKIIFVKCIEKTDRLINYFGNLFIETPNKELLNKFFNVKQALTFRRSYQDFYIIWLILDSISLSEENDFKESLLSDIRSLLCMLRNVNGVSVNEKYLNDFIGNMEAIRNKYKK